MCYHIAYLQGIGSGVTPETRMCWLLIVKCAWLLISSQADMSCAQYITLDWHFCGNVIF